MQVIKAFLKYRRQAVNEYSIHSPFVFEFYTEVVKKAKYYDDEFMQHVRRTFSKDHRDLEITDLGQGSKKNDHNIRRISEMARVQSIDRKYGKLLGTIMQHYKIDTCLELGTSLGIGSAYMAELAERVVTIEGCKNIHAEAQKFWNSRFSNIEFVHGEFGQVLPEVLSTIEKLDLAFVDGNHGYQPTLEYFEQIVEKAHNDTFILFDDINWSEDMRKAWDEICASDKINVSLEFFRMGIVLKRSEQAKEHFVLKF